MLNDAKLENEWNENSKLEDMFNENGDFNPLFILADPDYGVETTFPFEYTEGP